MIDLDDPGYFAEEDLAAYALACLQLTGDERPGNPYADNALAGPARRPDRRYVRTRTSWSPG